MNFIKLVFVIAFSLVILLSLFTIYYDSTRTKISNVKIVQNVEIKNEILSKRIENLLKNRSIFDIDKISIEKDIKSFSKEIKSVNLIVYPPDTAYVSLMFREPVIKLFTGNNYILYDEELNEISSYDKNSYEKAITIIPKRPPRREFLQDIAKSLYLLDKEIIYSRYFPDVFILDKDGIYGFNSTFKINIYFGYSIDESKVKKAFLSTKYIIQKKLPVRYIDARFDNVIAN